MKIVYIILFIILNWNFIGCTSSTKKDAHFTDMQIASLKLDSTSVLITNTDHVKTINLNPLLKKQNLLLDVLIDKVKVLPLETTNESLMDDIKKVLITKSYIYIVDYYKGGSVLIFNKKGKFIKRILQGASPQEIYNPSDITFDDDKQELIIYNKYYLSFFTDDGKFIKRERVPLRADEVTIIPDGYLFKASNGQGNQHFGFSQEYLFFVTDRTFKLKSIGLPYSLPIEVTYKNFIGYLHEGKQKVSLTTSYTDTIYEYDCRTNKLKVKYALDISEKTLPKNRLGKSWKELQKTLRENDCFLYNGAYLETQTHELFYVENWYIKLSSIIYRDKESGNMKAGTEMRYSTHVIPPINSPIATFGEHFISCYFPQNKYDLSNNVNLTEEDKRNIGNLKEDDNPVLVFFSLKNF